jgi:hypothetical protein
MKIELTVKAEFPGDWPYGEVEKFAGENGIAAAMRGAAVTYLEETPSDQVSPRRSIEWKSDCVDLDDVPLEGDFRATAMMAARRGIQMERRIRKLHPRGIAGEEVEVTVAWTAGGESWSKPIAIP